MADAVLKTDTRLRTVRPPSSSRNASGRLGASVKQHVLWIGLAALQFAAEACCAQSRAADELFPRGSLFPCAAYSVGSGPVLQANADLLRFRPSSFNLLGPQYGPHQTVLQDAKAYGLRAIYTVGADVDFLKEKGLPKPVDELAAEVKAQVSKGAPMVDPSGWIQDLSIEAFGKTVSVPAVGVRAIRHRGAVYGLLANSTGKEISGYLQGLSIDEPVWSMVIPSIGPESLKRAHFVLGPWGTLVVKAPSPK